MTSSTLERVSPEPGGPRAVAGCDLRGLGVLVTRPRAQADGLCDLIEAAGGRALRLPTVEIEPPADPDAAARLLAEPWDVLIFISRNAVEGALALATHADLGRAKHRGAVGKATAAAMVGSGIPPTLLSEDGFDSEALLALHQLSQVDGKRVLIVRGEGGRALLGDTLSRRGATVCFAEVYRRALPNVDVAPLLPQWQSQLQLLSATSDEVLGNLLALVPASAHDWLKQLPLAVLSERNADSARRLGFQQVTAAGAGDAAMLAALCQLAEVVPPEARQPKAYQPKAYQHGQGPT